MRLEWDDGALVVGWSDSVERMQAQGSWPRPVYVSSVWLRVLARSLPNADPLTLQVRDGRLYAENFSRPCVDPEAPVAELNLPPQERARLLKKAVAILKPFRIGEADIEALVNRCEPEGTGAHPPEEDRMLKRLAEAWVLLSPFGVGAEDLYEMVQQRIRLAWKEGGLHAED